MCIQVIHIYIYIYIWNACIAWTKLDSSIVYPGKCFVLEQNWTDPLYTQVMVGEQIDRCAVWVVENVFSSVTNADLNRSFKATKFQWTVLILVNIFIAYIPASTDIILLHKKLVRSILLMSELCGGCYYIYNQRINKVLNWPRLLWIWSKQVVFRGFLYMPERLTEWIFQQWKFE